MNDLDISDKVPPEGADSIRLIAQMHAEREQSATWVQRLVSSVTTAIATPFAIAVLTPAMAGWIIGNFVLATLGHRMIDPPPFSGLIGVVTILSLYMVVLI